MDTTYVEEELDVKQEMEIKEEGITEKIEQRAEINKRKSNEIRSEESKKQKSEEYCIMCQEFGHLIASDCVTCFKCGIAGHPQRDCPSNQVAIQPNISKKVSTQMESKASIMEGRYDCTDPSKTPEMNKADRVEIVRECTEDLVSPSDLAKKWNCNPDTIRTCVRKAGKALPKQYKKLIYRDMPKQPMSAFYFFMREEGREMASKEHPNATSKEIGKIVGGLWIKLKDKTKWFEKAAVGKEKYEQEFNEWFKSLPAEYISSTTKPTDVSFPTEAQSRKPTDVTLSTEAQSRNPTDVSFSTEAQSRKPTDVTLTTEAQSRKPTDVSFSTEAQSRKPIDASLSTEAQYNVVFIEIETLQASNSSQKQLTQIGCHFLGGEKGFFMVIKPKELNHYLEDFKKNADLLQLLNMQKNETGNFEFRKMLEVTDKPSRLCVDEFEAMLSLRLFLGKNCILFSLLQEHIENVLQRMNHYGLDIDFVEGFCTWNFFLTKIGEQYVEFDDWYKEKSNKPVPENLNAGTVVQMVKESVVAKTERQNLKSILVEASHSIKDKMAREVNDEIRETNEPIENLELCSSFRPAMPVMISMQIIETLDVPDDDNDDKLSETMDIPSKDHLKTNVTLDIPDEEDDKTTETVLLNAFHKFRCVLCNRSFIKQVDLDHHNAALHNSDSIYNKLQQIIQNKSFKKQEYRDHNASVHGKEKKSNKELLSDFHLLKFHCLPCNRIFKQQAHLYQHNADVHVSKADRDEIIRECTEDLVYPSDLAKKWNCKPDTIRTWVRKAGKTFPKQYKKTICPSNQVHIQSNIDTNVSSQLEINGSVLEGSNRIFTHLDQHNADLHAQNYGKGQGYTSREFIGESDNSDECDT